MRIGNQPRNNKISDWDSEADYEEFKRVPQNQEFSDMMSETDVIVTPDK